MATLLPHQKLSRIVRILRHLVRLKKHVKAVRADGEPEQAPTIIWVAAAGLGTSEPAYARSPLAKT